MTFTAEDGPQDTAAAAYQHSSDILAAIAEKSRKQSYPGERAWVRVEVIEQLAFTLAARAEEAKASLAPATRLVEMDWLVTRSWNRLHHAELTDEQLEQVEDGESVDGPVRLSCGRTAATVSLPGVFTRMGAQRCAGCCRARGLPRGKGSPKNDDACRAVLGVAS